MCRNGIEIGPTNEKREPFWEKGNLFGSSFCEMFGPVFGLILGPDRLKRDQDEPKKDIKSLKVPKKQH